MIQSAKHVIPDQTTAHPVADELSSEGFIDLLRQHDERSFALLYEMYREKIYNLAYRMTGNTEDAADITQETFSQVYQHIDSFRGDCRLYTWIFTIARNRCFLVLKTRQRSTFHSFEDMIRDAAEETAPSGIEEAEKKHLTDQIKEGCLTGLIRCLSIYQRTAFILNVLLHFPIDDVAVILDKSEGATRVLIHRARVNLKRFLCKNCSVYDQANPCKCENLIGFSLKHGWISTGDSSMDNRETPNVVQIEDEIHNFQRIMDYYTNLNITTSSHSRNGQIYSLIKENTWMIFKE
jgi:RNA polymerase sigma-70 factor, ECF subfamily